MTSSRRPVKPVAALVLGLSLCALLCAPLTASAAGGCRNASANAGPGGQAVAVRVTILVGPTSCATARHVITDSLNSHASFRGHGGTAHRTIDGWTCYKPSLGFAGCLQGTRAILGRYSPAGCAPGYDRKLPRAAGGPKYADQINVLSITGVSCTQAAGLAHTFDVPHYSKKSSPHRIVTSLGTFHCHAVKSSASTIEGLCSVGKRRVHWYSARR